MDELAAKQIVLQKSKIKVLQCDLSNNVSFNSLSTFLIIFFLLSSSTSYLNGSRLKEVFHEIFKKNLHTLFFNNKNH